MHGVALHVCPLSKLTAHTQLEAETSGSLMADGASRFSSFFLSIRAVQNQPQRWSWISAQYEGTMVLL